MKKKVLILCTGNSCRSQMTEAMINHYLASTWQAFSAGTQPAGYVHPLALQVLAEIGILHSGKSKSVEQFQGQAFDLVITVCGEAAEDCPLWLGREKRVHIGFIDPAKATGSPEDILQVFRVVRDDIREKILPYLTEITQNAG